MASVEDDGYAFQAKSPTTLPVEMLTRVLENVSLKDALSFGQTNRDAFIVVSRNPNFANRACVKEFLSKPDTKFAIDRICLPGNNKFEKSTEKFCRDKAQDYLCRRVFDDWDNLISLGADGSYAVPNGFEAVLVPDLYRGKCPNDVKILTIPDSVRVIYDIGPKEVKKYLTSVKGMKNVKIIGDNAFFDCRLLKSITIPESVIAIGREAFGYCTSLTSITIPESVIAIGREAFKYCASLTSFTIPESVTEIRKATFKYCRDLESITIPSSVTIIEHLAFDECKSLKAVTLPDSIQEIESYAFNGCHSLESITIPDGVTRIGNYVFRDCRSLKKVIIPNSIQKIGVYVFAACPRLVDVTIPYSLYERAKEIFDEDAYGIHHFWPHLKRGQKTKYPRFRMTPYRFTFT